MENNMFLDFQDKLLKVSSYEDFIKALNSKILRVSVTKGDSMSLRPDGCCWYYSFVCMYLVHTGHRPRNIDLQLPEDMELFRAAMKYYMVVLSQILVASDQHSHKLLSPENRHASVMRWAEKESSKTKDRGLLGYEYWGGEEPDCFILPNDFTSAIWCEDILHKNMVSMSRVYQSENDGTGIGHPILSGVFNSYEECFNILKSKNILHTCYLDNHYFLTNEDPNTKFNDYKEAIRRLYAAFLKDREEATQEDERHAAVAGLPVEDESLEAEHLVLDITSVRSSSLKY